MAAITPTTWGQHTPTHLQKQGSPVAQTGEGTNGTDRAFQSKGSSELPGLLLHLPASGAEPLVQAGSPSLLEDVVGAQVSTASSSNQVGLSLLLEHISKRPGPLDGSLSSFSH